MIADLDDLAWTVFRIAPSPPAWVVGSLALLIKARVAIDYDPEEQTRRPPPADVLTQY